MFELALPGFSWARSRVPVPVACNTCGAVVDLEAQEKHLAWHAGGPGPTPPINCPCRSQGLTVGTEQVTMRYCEHSAGHDGPHLFVIATGDFA